MKTEPWYQIVRSISLQDAIDQIQQEYSQHPLVAVFRPLLAASEEILEREAAPCILDSANDLPEIVRTTLAEVFLNGIEQRLSQKGNPVFF